MRKAFLDIDSDYDGYISAEDISKFIGDDIDYRDVKILLKNRDSSKHGKIDFKDFCKWMGG